MKRILFLIAMLLSCIAMLAQPRSEEQAKQIASEFFKKKPQQKASMLSVVPQQKVSQTIQKKASRAKSAPAQQLSSYYIINDEANNRFVIVSADNRLYEILGYSDNGTFAIENVPDGLLFMLDEYDQQYDLVKELGITSVASPKGKENITPIAPLLSTKWGQGDSYSEAYWLQCPQYNGESCPSGCVATAMAQVMAYYKYPDNGQGGSVNYTTGKGIYQYMNFDSQHFDWSKMRDTYGYYFDDNGKVQWAPERTVEEKNEVAKLMHACGVSVFMEYTPSSSGAVPCDIPYALIHNFGFNPNLYYAEKDYYTRQTWDSLIVSELDAKRPILYGGRGSNGKGGHRFVLDGIDSDGRYHFNFGWNGSDDGYFELDALNPDNFNFSSRQSMMLLIATETLGQPSDVFYSDNFILSSTVTVGNTANAKFNPTCYSNKTNTQKVRFDGVSGVGVFDKDWKLVKSLYSSYFNRYAGDSYYSNVNVKFDASTFTEGSQYYIALYAQSKNSVAPTLMRTKQGNQDWYRATTKDGIVKLEPLAMIPDNPDDPDPEIEWPKPLTGNLKMLALDKAGEYKIWDVTVVQDGTDEKKYLIAGIDSIVTERGFTSEQNQNTVYGIYGDDGSFTIPVPQKLGENLFLNNYSSDGDLSVTIAQDGSIMQINEAWGTVERKTSGNNTTQENVSVYTSATFYPKAPVPVETPNIIISENHIMTIACGTEGAEIHYTLDGSTPTVSSQKYNDPKPIERNLSIKAIAIKDANTSGVAQLHVNDYVVSTPLITESGNKIYIKCPDAEHIYFTTDGSTPTLESEEYLKEYLEFSVTTTIKAIGIHEGWNNSDVFSYDYIVIPDVVDIIVLNNIKGQLASRIPAESRLTAKSLKVTGELDGTDITVIRKMLVDGNLEYLDIKGSTIKAGGDKYPYLSSMTCATEDYVIGRYMFSYANKLKAIELPQNTIRIDNGAFSNCNLLKEVTIPEGCAEIDQAFQSSKGLETVNLPNTLAKFSTSNFSYCPKLKAINVNEGNQNFKSIDGNLYSVDGKRLIRFANDNCSQYSIIDGTEIIGDHAFYCSNVENVIIPNSVTTIERSAFYSSTGLKGIVLPNSVEKLGDSAFEYCSNLVFVTLSSKITSILSGTFLGCSSLKSIKFPKSIKDFDRTAFNYCYSLQKFEVDAANLYYCSDDGVIYTKGMKSLVRCPIALYSEQFRIQEGVETISDNAFMGCKNITNFLLPLSIDSIGQHAFEDCSMNSIQLSDNVKFVGYQAFSSCDGLKTFVLPASLNEIANSMFIYDYALSFVKIHGDVTKIGSSAFRFCRKLSSIECTIRNIEDVEVGNLAFDGIPDDCTWYVPFGAEEKYKAQPWWVQTWKVVPIRENLLSTSTASVIAGKTTILPIDLKNDDIIRLLQFELRLSEGVSVLYDETEDDFAIEKTERATPSHTLQCAKLPNGNYQFVLSTMTLNNLSGKEGAITYITIRADETAQKGKYEAYISNIELTAVEEDGSLKAIRPNDFEFNINVDSNPDIIIKGDVNGDGKVDIADAVTVLNIMAAGEYNNKADVNGDQKVDIADFVMILNIMAEL